MNEILKRIKYQNEWNIETYQISKWMKYWNVSNIKMNEIETFKYLNEWQYLNEWNIETMKYKMN